MTDILSLIQLNQRYLVVFLLFIVLDMLTGTVNAVIKRELKSSVFREGLLKKLLELVIIIVAFSCDWAFNLEIIGYGTVTCLMLMEAWSIIENIEAYVPIPEVLKEFIENAKKNKS